MNKTLDFGNIFSVVFAALLFVIGVLNVFLVHPIPGVVYLLLAYFYLPQTNSYLREKLGFSISLFIKIILAVVLVMFTLGVSDLGDMIDNL